LMSMADQLDAACDEIDQWKAQRVRMQDEYGAMDAGLQMLERQLTTAREVLAFYENEQNWQANDLGMSAINKDFGKRARKALEKINGSK